MSCGPLTPSAWLGVSASISQPSGTQVPLFPRDSDVLAPLHRLLCFTQLQREIWGRATWYSSLSLSLFSKLRLSLSLRLSVAAMLTPAISSLCHSFLLSWTACYHHLSFFFFFFTVSPLTPVPPSLSLTIDPCICVLASAASSGWRLFMLLRKSELFILFNFFFFFNSKRKWSWIINK